MKNYYLTVLTVFLGLGMLFIYHQWFSPKIAYVDLNVLMQDYKRMAAEKAHFEKKAVGMRSELDSLLANWQQELQDYEKERPRMTSKELALQQELLASRQLQLNAYQQGIQQKIQQEETLMTQTVINDINDFLQKYGKENGYDIIFGATGSGNIMYAKDPTNLTEKVLEILNRNYQEKRDYETLIEGFEQ